jgi:uncharacterized membrane protein YqjE
MISSAGPRSGGAPAGRKAIPDRALLRPAWALGLALVLALQWLAIERQSLTGDEAYHLLAGHQALRYGANLLNWEHPPLAKLVGALPTLEGPPLAPPLRVERALPAIALVHRDAGRLESLTTSGRWLMAAVFALPLLVASAALGHHFGGPWAGLLLALTLGLAFPFVPFLGMILTDAPFALAALLTLLAAIGFVASPGVAGAVLLGLAFGLALVTKFTAVLMVPTLLAAFAWVAAAERDRRWARLAGEAAVAVLGALAVVWTVYAVANRAAPPAALRETAAAYAGGRGTLVVGDRLLPARAALTELAVDVPGAGQWLTGLLGVRAQNELGVYPCYAFGRIRADGFRWYFPAVVLLKTPIALLVAAAAGVLLGRPRRGRAPRSLLRPDVTLVVVTAVVYAAAAVSSSYNIGGVRHLLPVAPLLLLPLAVWLARRPRAGLVVVAVLAAESFALVPVWLAATNTWWLGERNPARLALSHGDLEYRQSFETLAAEAEQRGLHELRVLYPGLQPEVLRPYLPDADLVEPGEPTTPGWYAVSALVEQFVPAILHAEPGAMGDEEGLRQLALGYRPLWRRVRRGEDHGWIAGTFHLYRLTGRETPTRRPAGPAPGGPR